MKLIITLTLIAFNSAFLVPWAFADIWEFYDDPDGVGMCVYHEIVGSACLSCGNEMWGGTTSNYCIDVD